MTSPWLPTTASPARLEAHLRELGWGVWWQGGGGIRLTSPQGREIVVTGETGAQAIRNAYAAAQEHAGELLAGELSSGEETRTLDAFADFLRPLARQYEAGLGYPCYVQVDDYFGRSFESEGWLCEAHAEGFTAKYGGIITVNSYSPEEDGIPGCQVCGVVLGPFVLSNYGVESELKHWQANGYSDTPGDHYDLLALVEAVNYRGFNRANKDAVLALWQGGPQ